MNKKALFTVICLLFAIPGCRVQRMTMDLKKEAVYAEEEGGIFAADLLEKEGEPYVMGGWSAVRADKSRLGVFPISRIKVPVKKKEPMYLFFKCSGFERDRHPAEGFRFSMKKTVIGQVELEPDKEKLVEVSLPADILDLGDNVLQIHHILAPDAGNKIDPEQKRRIRTSVFNEMILSSHPDYEMTKKYIEAKRQAKPRLSDSLVQKVPSTLDFYADLADDARFEAKFEFVPADSSNLPFPVEVAISMHYQGEDEEILSRIPLDKQKAQGKIKIDLPSKSKVCRLRLQAGKRIDRDSLAGLLIWKKASVVMKQKKRTKPPELNKPYLEWKRSLADKNTVLIILDAARADHFSCYGYWRPTTPHLDKFAEEAVLFTHAFSEALTTRGSIGTLFTGFPLTVLSMYSITSQLPEDLPTLAQMFQQKKIKTAGFAGVGNVGSSFGFDRGFDQYFELYKEEDFTRKSQEYLPYLLPWLESNQDNPFFLYLHFKEPHAHYSPLPPFKGMFTGAYEESVDLSAPLNPIAGSFSDEQIEYIRAGYDENLASVDSVVGAIIEKMRSLDMLDESIIIVTADHGELLGEQDKIFGHGGYFGEGGMHIPLLIRFPKNDTVKLPAKIDALIKMSDLMMTIADIHRFEIKREFLFGRTLLPLIQDKNAELNPYIVTGKRGTPGYCFRTKQHKLIYWMGNGPLEFYNLEKDPGAMNNVYEQNKIMAHYYLTTLKKWIASQNLIRGALLKGDPSRREIDLKQIDEKTLQNLKALGYIK